MPRTCEVYKFIAKSEALEESRVSSRLRLAESVGAECNAQQHNCSNKSTTDVE